MVFYICIVGGLGLGLIMAGIAMLAGSDLTKINPLVSYLVPFIPAVAYVVYKSNRVAKNNLVAAERGLTDEIVEPVPIDSPHFGKANGVAVVAFTIIATLCSMIMLEPLTSFMPMPDSLKLVFEQMVTNTLWMSLSVAVAAPLLEEFFIRGIMLRGMLKHTTPLKAILFSAMFFALIHMNIYQAVTAFLIGVFMGWIYYRSGSLWLTILIHFVNNGTSTLFAVLFPQMDMEATYMDMIIQYAGMERYIAIYALCLVSFAAIIYYFNKNLTYGQGKKTISL